MKTETKWQEITPTNHWHDAELHELLNKVADRQLNEIRIMIGARMAKRLLRYIAEGGD